MKPKTCEFRCRPSIGISEFGESAESVPEIKHLLPCVDLNKVVEYLKEVKQVCEMFKKIGNYPMHQCTLI